MMQVQNLAASNTQNGIKIQAATKLVSEQKTEKAKQVEVVDSPKPPSFSRTLEAYSDCV